MDRTDTKSTRCFRSRQAARSRNESARLWPWREWTAAGVILVLYAALAAFQADAFRFQNSFLWGSKRFLDPGQEAPNVYWQLDSFMWVAHAQALCRQGGFRVRYTDLDNAPRGREVHWSSGFLWLLTVLGWMRHVIVGRPLESSIDQAAPWANVVLFALFLALVLCWGMKRFGWIGGMVVGCVLLGQSGLTQLFDYGYVDHHGLIAALGTAGMLALTAGGLGWVRTSPAPAETFEIVPNERDAGRLTVASGIFWGMNMWVSAVTQVLFLLALGCGAILGILLYGGGREEGSPFRPMPSLWLLWAKAGALTSLGFYLLEYFPSGWTALRLEVNHPLYALAWWGGGRLLYWAARTRANMKPVRGERLWNVLGLCALAMPPVLLATLGWKVYTTVWELFSATEMHRSQGTTFWAFFDRLSAAVLLVLLGTFFFFKRGKAPLPWRHGLLTVLVSVGCLVALGCVQVRWLSMASVFAAPLALVVLQFAGESDARGKCRIAPWPAFVLCAALSIAHPIDEFPVWAQKARERVMDERLAPILGAREIALALGKDAKSGEGAVALAGPNNSVILAQCGGLKVLGTLYWENCEGLRNAARAFAAQNDLEAAILME